MIRVLLTGHAHLYPVSDVLRQFFGPVRMTGETELEAGDACSGPDATIDIRLVPEKNVGRYTLCTSLNEGTALVEESAGDLPMERIKREIKRQLYHVLAQWTGTGFPWGSLTGIRPTLIARECLDEAGGSHGEAARRMTDRYDVTPAKARLAVETAEREDAVQREVPPDGLCVYVGIPFCPSRCAYCSFTLPECSVRMDLAPAYVDALIREARTVFASLDTPVSCVYVGGGTPTSLTAAEFDRMLSGVLGVLPGAAGAEITVEAGRPDTLDDQKLRIMRDLGVTRVCVNPQTLHDGTLRRIGRRHTTAQTAAAVEKAVRSGIPVLNMDLIAGLPGETPDDFIHSLRTVVDWSPANVTIHALSMKRKSVLTGDMRRDGSEKTGIGSLRLPDAAAASMLDTAYGLLTSAGLRPYYLYRQKDSVGGLENTGYAAPGAECRYNVCMMGDRRSIIGLGSGAMTKRVDGSRVERIPTVREIGQYIQRSDEMADRILQGFLG